MRRKRKVIPLCLGSSEIPEPTSPFKIMMKTGDKFSVTTTESSDLYHIVFMDSRGAVIEKIATSTKYLLPAKELKNLRPKVRMEFSMNASGPLGKFVFTVDKAVTIKHFKIIVY